eukprot:TRINITY_DN5400_c0_g3_i1.p1 TRINITY_DN5400_c0_g3~~TRINITY_DN5400_c0_g3_i1.p1  ORF type:complete len:561 (+),score=92.94 TRINITY_DN5400_c0_g3_i1:43-1725(+)
MYKTIRILFLMVVTFLLLNFNLGIFFDTVNSNQRQLVTNNMYKTIQDETSSTSTHSSIERARAWMKNRPGADYGTEETKECSLRNNRMNPRKSSLPCPVTITWNSFMTTKGPHKYSTVNCSEDKHCVYENICLASSLEKKLDTFHFYQRPEGKLRADDFGFRLYRWNTKTVSWHYFFNIFNTDEKTMENSEADWVSGTSLLFDQSYENLCHEGHGSEFYFKLPYLRTQFPTEVVGKIDRILYSRGKSHFCHVTCNMLRLSFKEENWTIPPLVDIEGESKDYPSDRSICFEKLIIPSNQHQMFGSEREASLYRQRGLEMCNIEKRRPQLHPNRLFFFERGFDRQISNGDQLCVSARKRGLETYMESIEDIPDFCDSIALINSADIIVGVEGSNLHMLSFAHPGSVAIIVYPPKFYVQDWKNMAFRSDIRVLEYFVLSNLSWSCPVEYPCDMTELYQITTNQSLIHTYNWNTRIKMRHVNSYFNPMHFDWFLDYAMDIWDNPHLQDCEIPLLWPKEPRNVVDGDLWYDSWELNHLVCEPPKPNCVCCHDENCIEWMNAKRGF